VGKHAVLGLGFQMGANKFKEKYGHGSHPLKLLCKWLGSTAASWAPAVPKLWYGLEAASVRRSGRATAPP